MSEFDMPTTTIASRMSLEDRLKRVGFPEGMTPRQANAITQARLQFALSQLAEMNVETVHKWLNEVGEKSPAEAVRLYLELLEFRMPRMKAATVIANLNPGDEIGGKQMKDMSIAELQSLVAEQ